MTPPPDVPKNVWLQLVQVREERDDAYAKLNALRRGLVQYEHTLTAVEAERDEVRAERDAYLASVDGAAHQSAVEAIERLTRERDEARALKVPATTEEVLQAEMAAAVARAERDAADCTLRDGGDARHCRPDTGLCLRCERDTLKALLREVADVVANCCNCLALYDDHDLPHRLIDRVNAALEGRDE